MKQYEYKIINTLAVGVPCGKGNNYDQRFEAGLNELGKEGWLLCGLTRTYLIFCREIVKVPKPKRREA